MAKRGTRDEFSQFVKDRLSDRVGALCSKPDCRRPTKGPHSDEGRVLNLGQASHINAAAPHGPRYDSSQTPAHRGSAANGIWLCLKHAREVDADVSRFPAAELRRWKAETEQYRREQVSGCPAKAIPLAAPSMIALGPEVIALGRVLRTRGTQWTLQLDEFIVGEIATLRLFGDSFFDIPESERFYYCEAERIGRLITEPPSFISGSGLRVKLSVAAPLPRAQSLDQYHVDRLGPEPALDLSSDEPDLDLSGREIEGRELVPQILYFHLNTCKGGWGYGACAGSRVGELFHRFSGGRLESFITMEIIRLATVPCITEGPPEQRIPFGFIERVRDVRVLSLPTEASDILKASLTLDIFGMEPNQEFVISISTSIVELGPKPRLQFPGLDSLEVS